MTVKKLNQLNFHSNSNFCDYIKLAPQDNNYIEIIDDKGEIKSYFFKKIEYETDEKHPK